MKSEFSGDILAVRAVEDCIRDTRKYTKGAFSKSQSDVLPVQGNFPSKVVSEYYEIYPDTEISWDMPASKAIDWAWGDVVHIDVRFLYDYRNNKARIVVNGGEKAVEALSQGIPNFKATLDNIAKSTMEREKHIGQTHYTGDAHITGTDNKKGQVMDSTCRDGSCPISRS